MSTTSDDTRISAEDPKGPAPEGVASDPLLDVTQDFRVKEAQSHLTEGVAPDPLLAASPAEEPATPAHAPNGTEPKPKIRIPRTALRILRWALGGLALLAAFGGQAMAEDARQQGLSAPPQMSWILFGVGGLLFAGAMWPVARQRPAVSSTFFRTLKALPRRRKLLFLIPLGLSILLGLVALPQFISLNADPLNAQNNWLVNTGSWVFYIIALLLFALAFIVWERSVPPTYSVETQPPGDRLPRRIEWAIMGGLLLLAVALRVPGLENAPPGLWFDEAQNGLVAQRITAPNALHPTFITEMTQMGALYFYFQSLVLKVFGGDVWPLRILPALAGALIAPMLYLLASRLYGWRVGLAAGGLVAVSAWNITFSRIGFASLVAVAFNVAVYLCIAQALRTGRLGYYAGAGVLLGLGMQTYYVARLVPFVLIAVLLHRLVTERLRLLKALRSGLVVFAVGALLAFMPVGLFALQNGAEYNARVDEVSIFREGGGGDPKAFEKSLNAHALMFNFLGDRNGRHNLPGSPMLDWLVAALFFSGLASCALRAWRWQYFFPVVWLGAAVSGGVLSLLFEAPQAHRALEASVVVSLLAGIFLGELWGLLTRAWSPAPSADDERRTTNDGYEQPAASNQEPKHRNSHSAKPITTLPVRQHATHKPDALPQTIDAGEPRREVQSPSDNHRPSFASSGSVVRRLSSVAPKKNWAAIGLSALGVLAAVAWSGAANAQKYFSVQLKDRGVWKEMYTAEAEAGRMLARYGPTHDVYITPIYLSLPPSQYLSPNRTALAWPGMHALPLAPTAARDVVIVLDPPSSGDLSLFARLYPNARFEVLQSPNDPTPLLYTAIIPTADINALQGVRATVQGADPQRPAIDATVPKMEFDWGAQGVSSGTLRLSATFRVQTYGPHGFELQTADGGPAQTGSLLVDGFPIEAGQAITLGVGIHSVVLTDTLRVGNGGGGSGVTRLQWIPATSGTQPIEIPPTSLLDPRKVEPRGLTGIFREGNGFAATPKEGRLEPVISAYFHHTPLPRPYTAEWTGRLYIPEAGQYAFATEQLSRSTLYIDERELISNQSPNSLIENVITLTQGWHAIRMTYEDYDGYSHVYLYWTPPGKGRTIIPSAFLWPDMGQYPDRPESGPFPTLADYDGTWLPPERVGGAILPQRGPGQQQVAQPNQPPVSNPPPSQPQGQGTPIEPLYALGSLAAPFAVAGDMAGNAYVFTVSDSRMRKFGPGGELVAEWAAQSEDGAPLTEVSAMLVHSDTLLALDAERSEVISYTLDGELQGRRKLCECYNPRGMFLAPDGNFWVSDTGGGRVLKVSDTGQLISLLGERGSEPGKFIEPVSVWETPGGILYVADVGNSRVQSFTADGKPLAQWAMGMSDSRDGNRLTGDGENVLVTDGGNRSIARYDSQGKELGRWFFARNGEVLAPSGIAPVGEGRVAVLYLKGNYGIVFKP